MTVDRELIDILACPQCRGPVEPSTAGGKEALLCPSCRLLFRVEDGIPVMLLSEAERMEE